MNELPGQAPSPSQMALLASLEVAGTVQTQSFHVGGRPETIAVVAGKVLVPACRNHKTELALIDPVSVEVVKTIQYDFPCAAADIIHGTNEAWVVCPSRRKGPGHPGDGALIRLDLGTWDATETHLEHAACSGVIAGDALCLANSWRRSISVIDLASGKLTREILLPGEGYWSAGIAFYDRLLWVPIPGTVLGIDVTTGDQLAAIPHGGYGASVFTDSATLWLSTISGVSKVRPIAGPLTAATELGDYGQRPVLFGEDVWVPNYGSGTVSRIDASTAEVTATIEVGVRPFAIAAGEGAVWVANQGDGTVTRIGLPFQLVPERPTGLGGGRNAKSY